MTEDQLLCFLNGVLVLASGAIAAFFLRFWRDTRQTLFLAFAVAFLLLSANWLLLAIYRTPDESRATLYALRVAAFVVLIAGIWHHNRASRR